MSSISITVTTPFLLTFTGSALVWFLSFLYSSSDAIPVFADIMVTSSIAIAVPTGSYHSACPNAKSTNIIITIAHNSLIIGSLNPSLILSHRVAGGFSIIMFLPYFS